MPLLDKATFEQIVALIEPHMRDEDTRLQHIEVTFAGTEDPLPRIDYDGPSMTVTEHIVIILIDYGKRALWRLLKLRMFDIVGIEQQEQITAWESLLNLDDLRLHSAIQPANTAQKPTMRCPQPEAAPEKFGGRDQFYADVMERLKADDTKGIIAIHGVGGIGKTTLARKVAHDLYHTEKCFKAVVWTSVNQKPDVIALLTRWGDYGEKGYAAGSTDVEGVKQQVKDLLQAAIDSACPNGTSERVLIVLDDVWSDGIRAVETLLSIKPQNTTVLLTSPSSNLLIDLEVDEANIIALPYMEAEDAVKMLREHLDKADEGLLKELAAALGGHPLSMELAAKRVLKEKRLRPTASLDSTLQRCIDEYQQGLAEGMSFKRLQLEQGDDKERNLSLALATGYDALEPETQHHFRALGILAVDAPFDMDLLAAIWELEQHDVETHLLSLLELGLVSADTKQAEDWYTQHRLLRTYAALLNDEEQSTAIFRRYAEYVTLIAEQFEQLPIEEWGVLTPYLPHIHEVGDAMVKRYAGDSSTWTELALNFAYATQEYLKTRPEALFKIVNDEREPARLQWLEMGLLASREQKNREWESVFLYKLGYIHPDLGNMQQGLEYLLLNLELERELGDTEGESATLNLIGTVYSDLGEYEQALTYHQQALPLAQEIGDKDGEASTLNNIGTVYYSTFDYQQALTYFQQALPLAHEVGNTEGEANTLNNIGRAYSELGDKQQALAHYQQALPLCQQVSDKRAEAVTLGNIGSWYDDTSDTEQALKYYHQALILYQEVGDKLDEAQIQRNIGAVYKGLEQYEQALPFYQQNLLLSQDLGDKARAAMAFYYVGIAYEALGNVDEAISHLERCVELEEEVQHPDLESDREYLANLKRQRGK